MAATCLPSARNHPEQQGSLTHLESRDHVHGHHAAQMARGVFHLTAAPEHSNYFTTIIIHLHCTLGGIEEYIKPILQMERSSHEKKRQTKIRKKISSRFKKWFHWFVVVVLITNVIHGSHGHFFTIETNTKKKI